MCLPRTWFWSILFCLSAPATGLGLEDFPDLVDNPALSCSDPSSPVPFYNECYSALRFFNQKGFQTGPRAPQFDFREARDNEDDGENFDLYQVGGVVVHQRSGSDPDYVYVVDTGNSRILGYRSLGICGPGPGGSQGSACTNENDCNGDECIVGDGTQDLGIVLGAELTACCNEDCNIGLDGPASNTSLCLFKFPHVVNRAESWQKVNIEIDSQGNLYVPDAFNNRVLRFNDPLSTDTMGGKGDDIADMVWGQPDFEANKPNRGGGCSNESFNFYTGDGGVVPTQGGVSIEHDAQGNPLWLWVADTFNYRVLRFPLVDRSAANLVVGQDSFTDCVSHCEQNGVDAQRFCNPLNVGVALDNGEGDPELWVLNQDQDLDLDLPFEARFIIFEEDASTSATCTQLPCWKWNRTRTALSGYPNESCVPPPGPLANCRPGLASHGCQFQASGFSFHDPTNAYPNGFVWAAELIADRATLFNNLDDEACDNDVVAVVNSIPNEGASVPGIYIEECSQGDLKPLWEDCDQFPLSDAYDDGLIRPATGAEYRLCQVGSGLGFDDAGNIYVADPIHKWVSRF